MPCGWEGNRRSGVALAMRHRLQWIIQLRAHGLRKGDAHPAYTPRSSGRQHPDTQGLGQLSLASHWGR